MTAEQLIEKFQYMLDNKFGYVMGGKGQKWTEALQKQKVNYMINCYGTGWKNNSEAKADRYYYTALYGSKWIGHFVVDCSGAFVWAYKQLGGPDISHSSHYQWTGCCSSRGSLSNGKRTDGKTLKPGTAVFVDKNGKKTHIGLYVGDGDGKVIEAAGTQQGVIVSNVTDKKWEYWGELKAVAYGNSDDQGFPDKTGWRPTIRRGSKGKEVEELQTMLYKLGYDIGVAGIDGDYGRNTEKAVKTFQEDHRLTVDGVCGPMTWDELDKCMAKLNEKPKEKQYTVCIHHLDKTQADAMARSYPGCVVTEE